MRPKTKKIEIDRAEIIRFMGYREKKPDYNMMEMIDECEDELQRVIMPSFTFRILGITMVKEGIQVVDTPLILPGADIARHLEGCHRCALFAATLSVGADKLIKSLEATDLTRAYLTDAIAGAAVEALCEEAEHEISYRARSFRTWRYSPGYGDFPLEIQPMFLDVLNAHKLLGITVGENNIMIPRKSVTAVIGLSDRSIDMARQGCHRNCDNCRLRYKCYYSRD